MSPVLFLAFGILGVIVAWVCLGKASTSVLVTAALIMIVISFWLITM